MDLKIPKEEKIVEISLITESGLPKAYILFCSPSPSCREGEEVLDELLNVEKQFLPVKDAETKDFFLINSNHILYIKERNEISPYIGFTLEITFSKGQKFIVDHYSELHPAESRPSDYLNSKQLFLSFIHEGRKIFINKNHIESVIIR